MLINIAIDGPSASGKSTVSKALCTRLNYKHLDTGAMYRCVALKAKMNNVDTTSPDALDVIVNNIDIDFDEKENVYLDGVDVSKEIRTNEISMLASDVSAFKNVRESLVAMQKKIAANKGYIMDGRDIGTVVLPDAEVKIYLTASSDTRAMRRFLENKERGIESDLETLKKEIEDRDYQDMHRQNSPLKQADDAIVVDSSDLSVEEVVDEIMKLVIEKI